MKWLLIALVGIEWTHFAQAAPISIFDDFQDGIRSPYFTVSRSDTNFTHLEAAGVLRVSKASGATSGTITYTSNFGLLSNFLVQVTCNRTSGDGSIGIRAVATNGMVAIYYTTSQGGSLVYGTYCVGTTCPPGGSLPAALTQPPFRLRRENGNKIIAECRANGEWTILSLAGGLYGPVRIEFFLLAELETTGATSGTFDNLSVSDSDYVDLRSGITNAPTINRAVRICWSTEINSFYQLQARSHADTGTWSNVSSPMLAEESQTCYIDPDAELGKRFYRVLVTPPPP